jgi:hypothetical protein
MIDTHLFRRVRIGAVLDQLVDDEDGKRDDVENNPRSYREYSEYREYREYSEYSDCSV